MARNLFGGTPADVTISIGTDSIYRARPNSPVTMWDAEVGGNQYTDLALTSLGDSVSTITSNAQGRVLEFYGPPDGITEMWADNGIGQRYKMVSTQIGTLLAGKLGRDEVPHAHTHSLADIPGIDRSDLREINFDTVTNTWPRPAVLPTTRITFFPSITNPSLPPSWARPNFDLYYGPRSGATAVPEPTPEPEPEPDERQVTLSIPALSSSGAQATATATLTTNLETTFAYVQIAFRGPNGQKIDGGFNRDVRVAAGGTLALNATITATVTGVWTAFATYNITGGNNQTDWTDGPSASATVTIPNNGGGGTPGTFPQAGRSGLAWNSGGFVTDQWQQGAVNAFGTYRGKASDTMLVFAAYSPSDGWDKMHTIWDSWKGWPGIFILSIPPQPSGQNNVATASGQNDSRWRDFGSKLTAAGMNHNRTVIRLGWESNGNWYDWSWGRGGGAQQYVQAFIHVRNAIRQTAPNVKFDLCLNKDWNNEGGMTWQAVLAAVRPDVVGLDAYDMYDGFRNDEGRRTAWYNKSGPQRNSVAAWCRANNTFMSLDEWGLVASGAAGAGGTGGGDDALYITDTWTWVNANKDILAWESYYNDDGAPADLLHKLQYYTGARTAYWSSSRWGNH